MRYKVNTKIIIDKRKLDTLIRLNCPESVLWNYIKLGKLELTGDSLIDENLESLLDIKDFSNWGGERKNSGRKSSKNNNINQVENQVENQDENQDENQVENQDENQVAFQVGDKDRDRDRDINYNSSNINNIYNNNLNNNISNEVKEYNFKSIVYPREKKEFFFNGEVIKLNKQDFNKWKDSFPNIDLELELKQRDLWLASLPDKPKNWFLSTAQYLVKLNHQNKPMTREELREKYRKEAEQKWGWL